MKTIDLETWNRREHYEFFSAYEDPYFGIVSEIDASAGYRSARERGISFFAFYLHCSIQAANRVEAFRYRIQEGAVVVYDQVHAGTTIGRKDESFAFAVIPFSPDFESFNLELQKEIVEVENTRGLRRSREGSRKDLIHHSTFPWSRITGLSHPRNFNTDLSIPKITFGKAYERDSRLFLPVAVDVHHGLMDGVQVAKYLEALQQLMDR